jgi:hypothetical protein
MTAAKPTISQSESALATASWKKRAGESSKPRMRASAVEASTLTNFRRDWRPGGSASFAKPS